MKKIKKLRAKQICVPTLGRVILGQALVGLTETSPPHQIPEGLSSTPPEKCRPAYVEPVPTWGPLLLATRRATCTVAKAVTPFHSKKSLKIKTEERARERKETPLPLSLLLSLSLPRNPPPTRSGRVRPVTKVPGSLALPRRQGNRRRPPVVFPSLD
jgi:hypothetical protein